MNKVSRSAQSREYMTALFRRHSMVALGCCLLSLTLAFIGVIISVSTYAVESESGFYTFIYFTLISNTLAAITSTLIIPFAVV